MKNSKLIFVIIFTVISICFFACQPKRGVVPCPSYSISLDISEVLK